MNALRRFTITFLAIVTASLVGAGAASAGPHPEPAPAQLAGASQQENSSDRVGDHARQLLAHKSYVDRGQDELAEEAAAAARSRAAEDQPGSGLVVLRRSGSASTVQVGAASKQSGNGLEVPLLGVTALAGLALGAARSTASRRLRGFDSRRVGQGAS